MNDRLRRRMALSRAMLNRPHLVAPDDPVLRARGLAYLEDQIRVAQEDVVAKRQALQTAWTHYCALETEKRQILDDAAAEKP